ncbi:helix-turn-helix domain-containing protein [Halalkalibacter krulwichiae]|uniref:HTH-type transcriptional regulator Xre n=1 Tax=Halalkalibacter krulwichiae TaxID=199441 RepID=A0A1X9MM72_9BACI|nr:helix-turn-helix domain-containing protein [Halalkalibacter krulwichiae]ARK32182.1 HTH-type transcriptional regulator Xre [Halalkalibacter krulwichiae]
MSEVLGKRIKYLRDRSGLAQKYVAEKIGVKNNTLSGYESGRREPDSETLRKLADFFEVTTDYLLGRTDKPTYNIESTLPKQKSKEENLFFKDMDNITPEEAEELRKHLEFLRFKAAQENKNK